LVNRRFKSYTGIILQAEEYHRTFQLFCCRNYPRQTLDRCSCSGTRARCAGSRRGARWAGTPTPAAEAQPGGSVELPAVVSMSARVCTLMPQKPLGSWFWCKQKFGPGLRRLRWVCQSRWQPFRRSPQLTGCLLLLGLF